MTPSVPKFSKVNIEIGNICNLQCTFCPEVERPKGFMQASLFRNVIEQVAPLTEQVCLHLMGEPLLHPRLEELVGICEEFRTPIFFVTNGTRLNEKLSTLLLRPIFRQVNFSLHSFFDNYPQADATEYLDRIFRFTERAFESRSDLYVNYRLWDLDSIEASLKRHEWMLERIEARFGVAITRKPVIRRFKSRRLVGRLYVHFDTEFIWPNLSLPVLGEAGTCKGLSTHFGILVDGTVVPCCLDKEGVIPLGNITEMSLETILATERAVAIREGFTAGVLKEPLCQRCPYIQRFAQSGRAHA